MKYKIEGVWRLDLEENLHESIIMFKNSIPNVEYIFYDEPFHNLYFLDEINKWNKTLMLIIFKVDPQTNICETKVKKN